MRPLIIVHYYSIALLLCSAACQPIATDCTQKDPSCPGQPWLILRPLIQAVVREGTDAPGTVAPGAVTSCSTTDRFLVLHGGGLTSTSVYHASTNTFTAGPTLPATLGAGAHALRLPFLGDANCNIWVVRGGSVTTYLIDPTTMAVSAGPNLTSAAGNLSGSWVIPSGLHANDVFTVRAGSFNSESMRLDVETMTVFAGPNFPAFSGVSLHLRIPATGLFAGREFIWYAAGGPNTALLNYATLTISGGPGDVVNSAAGSNSFAIVSGPQSGNFIHINGSGSLNTSIYQSATNTIVAGPPLNSGANGGAHNFLILTGPHAGKHMALLNATSTNLYDPASNTFAIGPGLTANTNNGNNFTIPSGPQAGNQLVVLGNGTITNIYNTAAGTFAAGPSTTAAVSGNTGPIVAF